MPLAWLFGAVSSLRAWLYAKQYLAVSLHPLKIVSVGNLTVGGTGKTPHTEYLIQLFAPEMQVATLSRGYGRQTKGFLQADSNTTPEQIGDEPYQIFGKWGKQIKVAACENRNEGVQKLLKLYPNLQLILLDDAYQHQAIHRNCNILLTDYYQLFCQDHLLPAGRLRERRKAAKRADLLIVTKCPQNLTSTEATQLNTRLKPYLPTQAPIFFSSFQYGTPLFFGGKATDQCPKNIVLLTGIAQTHSLESYLNANQYQVLHHFKLPDHVHYTKALVEKIATKTAKYPHTALLTTEKDMVKLKKFANLFETCGLFCLPIEVVFLFEQKNIFEQFVQTKLHQNWIGAMGFTTRQTESIAANKAQMWKNYFSIKWVFQAGYLL